LGFFFGIFRGRPDASCSQFLFKVTGPLRPASLPSIQGPLNTTTNGPSPSPLLFQHPCATRFSFFFPKPGRVLGNPPRSFSPSRIPPAADPNEISSSPESCMLPCGDIQASPSFSLTVRGPLFAIPLLSASRVHPDSGGPLRHNHPFFRTLRSFGAALPLFFSLAEPLPYSFLQHRCRVIAPHLLNSPPRADPADFLLDLEALPPGRTVFPFRAFSPMNEPTFSSTVKRKVLSPFGKGFDSRQYCRAIEAAYTTLPAATINCLPR